MGLSEAVLDVNIATDRGREPPGRRTRVEQGHQELQRSARARGECALMLQQSRQMSPTAMFRLAQPSCL